MAFSDTFLLGGLFVIDIIVPVLFAILVIALVVAVTPSLRAKVKSLFKRGA